MRRVRSNASITASKPRSAVPAEQPTECNPVVTLGCELQIREPLLRFLVLKFGFLII